MFEPGPAGENAGVYVGDNRELMRQMPAQSVHCVVTSPPYWGLRDYGTAEWEGGDAGCDHKRGTAGLATTGTHRGGGGVYANTNHAEEPYRDVCAKCGARRVDSQLGLESTPEEYVANQVAVFREVWRVLRDDGCLWLNLGDSYAGGGGFWKDAPSSQPDAVKARGGYGSMLDGRLVKGGIKPQGVIKPKDLVGIPWRVAFALQADGWYLRSDIIWAKGLSFCDSYAGSCMPESVTDRPTKGHEYLFLLTKRPRYFYDAEAVREAVQPSSIERAQYAWSGSVIIDADGKERRAQPDPTDQMGERWAPSSGRNLRTVWAINPGSFPGAHFATFPPALVEPCIKAGTSERGVCPECGAQWKRIVKASGGSIGTSWHNHDSDLTKGNKPNSATTDGTYRRESIGWQPTCTCDAGEPVPAIVFDPYMGAGTTGLVAFRLGRRYLGCELNPTYAQMARDRIVNDAPMLAMIG